MFTVYDGERQLQFAGALLGHASSARGGKSRWIEISLHKTNGGKYIISGVGRTTVKGETDRRWAHVSDTPQGAIECLHLFDSDGVRYLTRTAKLALADACAQDERLRDAYMFEVID